MRASCPRKSPKAAASWTSSRASIPPPSATRGCISGACNKEPPMKVPRGAVDTHMHFYDEKVPGKPGAPLPGHFDVAQYRALQKRLGLERVIVVQPNAYRDDNSVTLAAMKQLGSAAKGVAVGGPPLAQVAVLRLPNAGIFAVGLIMPPDATPGLQLIVDGEAREDPTRLHPHIH